MTKTKTEKFEVIKIEHGGYYTTGEGGQFPPQGPNPKRKEIPLGTFEVAAETWHADTVRLAVRLAGLQNVHETIATRNQRGEYDEYNLIIGYDGRVIGKIKQIQKKGG